MDKEPQIIIQKNDCVQVLTPLELAHDTDLLYLLSALDGDLDTRETYRVLSVETGFAIVYNIKALNTAITYIAPLVLLKKVDYPYPHYKRGDLVSNRFDSKDMQPSIFLRHEEASKEVYIVDEYDRVRVVRIDDIFPYKNIDQPPCT